MALLTQFGVPYAINNTGLIANLAAPTIPNVPFVLTSTPVAGVAQAPHWSGPGVSGRAITGATSTDAIANTDCGTRVEYVGSAAVAITLPTATTFQLPKCSFKLTNNLSTVNDLTITTTTWTCNGAATCVLHNGQIGNFGVDPNSATNWVMDASEQALIAGTGITITRTATTATVAATISGTADAALDNLAAVAINLGLTPGASNTIDLGSNTKYWANLLGHGGQLWHRRHDFLRHHRIGLNQRDGYGDLACYGGYCNQPNRLQ